MVQPKKSAPSGTFRGARNGPQTAVAEKEMPGMRVKSAKQLREEYVELQQSPDGMDPDPLTIPKCVECGHCGWPVYPRDSKVATKKTFARAGIVRGTRKEEEAKRAAEGGGDDDDEEEGSEDSRNTEERLRDELEDLQDRNGELEKENMELKEEKEELEKTIEDQKQVIEEQTEQIDFMEQAEERWRDLLDKAELRNEELTLSLERAGLVSADRERGLVVALQEIAQLREEAAAFKRRRTLMLIALEQKLKRREGEDYLAATLRLWRTFAVKDRLTREAEDLERVRHRDVSTMQDQVAMERMRMAAMKAAEAQLRGRLRAAGQRLLMRALSNSAQPVAQAHALRAWSAAKPVLALEKTLKATEDTLEETKTVLQETTERNAFLEADYGKVVAERDQLQDQNADLRDQVEYIKMEGGRGRSGSKDRDLEAQRRQRLKEEAESKKALQEAQDALSRERAERAEEKEELENEIEALQSRLEVAEAAAMSNAGNTVPEVDEASRICPKGQGVLCVGCLKQLVHRGVRPLPPVTKLHPSASGRLERAKEAFFEQELRGAPVVDDEIHTYAWRARKDPYGVARLTVWPRRTATKGSKDASGLSPPSSPSGSDTGGFSPKTGLPALKKSKKLRAEGVVSPLKMSMRDFKPAHFR